MWPDLGSTQNTIAFEMVVEGLFQGLVLAPPRRVAEIDVCTEQSRAVLLQRLERCRENPLSHRIDTLPKPAEFRVPRRQRIPASAAFQRRITLLQRAAKLAPQGQVIRFHVERQPVQEPPALIRPAADQVVDIRVNDLQR